MARNYKEWLTRQATSNKRRASYYANRAAEDIRDNNWGMAISNLKNALEETVRIHQQQRMLTAEHEFKKIKESLNE